MKYYILILLVFLSCTDNNSNDEKESNETNEQKELNLKKVKDLNHKKLNNSFENKHKKDDFKRFLKKFVSDSAFRYKRVKFPLNGYNTETENEKKDYVFKTKEDWDFYSSFDIKTMNSKQITQDTIFKDSVVIWNLYKKNSGYNIKYKFKKRNSKWYLLFYSYKNI